MSCIPSLPHFIEIHSFILFFKVFFLCRLFLKILNLFQYCFCLLFCFALRHVGPELLDQRLNPYPLCWKAKSWPLDHQGSPLESHNFNLAVSVSLCITCPYGQNLLLFPPPSFSLIYRILAAAAAAATAKSLQLCPTLCDCIDGSPPGSPIPGILQARTLEWAAISFSNAWKWKVKMKSLSHVWLLATPWTVPYQAPPSMGFSRQEYWSGLPLPSLIGFLTNPKTKFWGHFVQNAYQDCSESIIFSSVLAQYYYWMWPFASFIASFSAFPVNCW